MATFQWITEPVPDNIPIRQVYGFVFEASGRLLLRDDRGRFGLPGGRPEPGEDAVTTLTRECMEETQITIGTPIYLGYQKVTEDDGYFFAQIRMITLIKDILPSAPDPDTGRTYGRVLVPINKVPALLDWGIDGLLQSADAAVAAIEHLGIDLGANREETRLDY